jgi:hypothetical protein
MTAMSNPWKYTLALTALALSVIGVILWRATQREPTPTLASPYRNVHPGVKYVGDPVCAGCHQEIMETYAKHPMGQALAPMGQATPIEHYDAKASNPFTTLGISYSVSKHKDRVVQREAINDPRGKPIVALEEEVHYAIGSGARARSYLINREGYLFQAPVSWYPGGGKWELSPSYDKHNQHFGRIVGAGCLFCHCNLVEPIPDTVNRYREPVFRGHAIGCERCHGPGELHVKRHTEGNVPPGLDDTIVNPARLDHSRREAVCQQCHLQGEQRIVARGLQDFDYRPGLPLHDFLMDFVDGRSTAADSKFVGSVEQMVSSRCYKSSEEPRKLGCISCHDPHKHPSEAEKAMHYRQRCLRCHTESSCTVPVPARRAQTKDDSCIFCHMPRTGSEVNHTSITDHRIPRKGERAAPGPRTNPPGPDDLVPFHRDLIDPTSVDLARNHGLALMAMLNTGPPDKVARGFARKALPLLERALERDANDVFALEAKGDALVWNGQPREGLAAYEQALKLKPELESSLDRAGTVALSRNDGRKARAFYERAVKVNPWRWHYYQSLAKAAFILGDWERGVSECQQSLKLEPTNTSTRSLLVLCYLGMGEKKQAEAEYETMRQLTPEAKREALKRWYEERSK